MNLIEVFKKTVTFLNKEKIDYIIIGGMAVGIWGEPRATGDVDVDIILDKNELEKFLEKLDEQGFIVSKKKCLKGAKTTGTFQVRIDDCHIDFIICSIELEKEAIRRKKVIKLHGADTNLPTPEDLILLKIIPGRPKDIADAESIVIKNSGKLNKEYLLDWAMKLSDETEDARIHNEIKRLLKQ
ncbi:MAG: nucleotidyltransferase [Elusimicrobiota bacterium]